jgi:hypothetical protein
MCTTKAIYISFDLGLRGDYNGLYVWLDSMHARECGNNVALVQRDFDHDDHNSIYESFKSEITTKVRLEPTDRIYISLIGADGQMKGRFLFGGRKRALWEGFSSTDDSVEDSI